MGGALAYNDPLYNPSATAAGFSGTLIDLAELKITTLSAVGLNIIARTASFFFNCEA